MKKNILEILFLFPLSILYWIVVAIRNKLFDLKILKSVEFDLPVIGVGNITVGGTGKTPHVEYLVRFLKNKFKVATLSRGYKRKTNEFVLADDHSTVADIGDEPLQIKKKFPDVAVAVEKRRVKGIRKLLQLVKPEVILLDDAYQHRYVKPGLSILLIDYNRPVSEDYLLPFGRLRERAFQKKRANIVIITKCPANLQPIEKRLTVKDLKLYPYQSLYFTTLAYGHPVPVFEGVPGLNLEKVKSSNPTVLMVTGIANPKLFKNHIKEISPRIRDLVFPDHHNFNPKDLEKIAREFDHIANGHKIILTTEKDATRFRDFREMPDEIRNKLFYIPLEITFLHDGEKAFQKQVMNYVQYNDKNEILQNMTKK